MEGFADGFEARFVDFAGIGISAAWGGKAVDDKIDGAHFLFDGLDGKFFNIVGEGVAIDAAGVEALGLGGFFESEGVIPAGGGGAAVGGGTFKEDAEGFGLRAESSSNARGETVASGGADDEDVFGSAFEWSFRLDVVDLLLDVSRATFRVSGDADESADFWFDDVCHSIFFKRIKVLKSETDLLKGMRSQRSILKLRGGKRWG